MNFEKTSVPSNKAEDTEGRTMSPEDLKLLDKMIEFSRFIGDLDWSRVAKNDSLRNQLAIIKSEIEIQHI